MKRAYFIKHDQRIKRIIGCDRATLIFDRLEFYSSRQPDGFYKFIEPNSHRLYKKDDSWTELLDCHRTSFWRAFKLIGKKHVSRWSFEQSKDKFEGKLYASYYDRLTNRMFFIRNHEAVEAFLAKVQAEPNPSDCSRSNHPQNACLMASTSPSSTALPLASRSVGTEQNVRSYIETKNTSKELSKDNSHASDEIVKKMIEFWTALVEEGKGQIELTSKRIAFLKQAFKDKFNNCLEKWKKYCQDIASSRFLMGEIKSSFRATLDWALKFEIIQKILEGNYGIGDRNPLSAVSAAGVFFNNSKIDIAREAEEIQQETDEAQSVKAFRLKWLNKLGASNYRECFKTCVIEVSDETTLILRPSSRYTAKLISSWWVQALLDDSPFKRVNIVQKEGELVFDKWFGESQRREELPPAPEHKTVAVKAPGALNAAAPIVLPLPEITEDMKVFTGRSPEEGEAFEGEQPKAVEPVSAETQILREKLRQILPPHQFPGWLGAIEVDPMGKDGKIVVTFKDPLAVEWCRLRLSQEIFQVAASLWKGVNRLVIRQKEGDTVDLFVENFPQKSENVKQKMSLEQGIQSLVSAFCDRSQGMFAMRNSCQTLG